MLDVPVLFLVFNRPDLSELAFNEIRAAKPRQLFIAADGPRPECLEDPDLCRRTRMITDRVDWECDLKTLFRETNQGCKNAIASAISWFFDEVDQGIILEDDCVPGDSFFHFCRELLSFYKDTPEVMHISGNNYQFGAQRGQGSYFFTKYNHIHGWATWRRAWRLMDLDMDGFPDFEAAGNIQTVIPGDKERAHWLRCFTQCRSGEIDNWDYAWTFSIWRNGGLAIQPNRNLVTNIDYGTEATHTQKDSLFCNVGVERLDVIEHPETMAVNGPADRYNFELLASGKFPPSRTMASDPSIHGLSTLNQVLADINAGRPEAAVSEFENLIRDNPDQPELHYPRALALFRMGAQKAARRAVETVLGNIPGHPKARQLAAMMDAVPLPESPLTGSANTVLVDELDVQRIIRAYQGLQVDVRDTFKDLRVVHLYECGDTDFRFYHPFWLAGGGELYEALEKHSWYYMPWKWEHRIASDVIHPRDRLLEVGSARGDFLKAMMQKGVSCRGLEINTAAGTSAREKGIDVRAESIEAHALHHEGDYTVVCAFQVLEHIVDVRSFLEAAIRSLTAGGRLILSVPNNDAFMLRRDPVQILNRPPHHMGLWNTRSLVSLGRLFGITLESIAYEPLQPYHMAHSRSLVKRLLVQKGGAEATQWMKDCRVPLGTVTNILLSEMPGHTTLAVYLKN